MISLLVAKKTLIIGKQKENEFDLNGYNIKNLKMIIQRNN
jgi:hypothetical protein